MCLHEDFNLRLFENLSNDSFLEWVYSACLFLKGSISSGSETEIFFKPHGNRMCSKWNLTINGFTNHWKTLFCFLAILQSKIDEITL